MQKLSAPVFERLSVNKISAQSIEIKTRRMTFGVTVLAEDLFRLRCARGAKLSKQPSWAVAKSVWRDVPARIRSTPHRVSIRSAAGSLTIQLADGRWELSDAKDAPVFTSSAGATGFAGDQARVSLALVEGERIFGLGETTATFNKRGLIREFWNTDVLGHVPAIHPGLRSLYVSIPFGISLRGGRAAGLFWDNPARQTWDLGQTKLDQWQMQAASGEIDLYLFLGPKIGNVVGRYTELTGRMPMPPRWALGYHQCRYSYKTRRSVEAIARAFRRKQIPCDVLYLDIDHMDRYRVFTFGRNFSRPGELMTRLEKQGFKVVTIVDPGVKDDPEFGVWKRGIAHKAFVKGPDGGKDFIGKVWPGAARFPDFLDSRVRAWWGAEQARLQRLGVAGFWNDMNEPANFGLPTKTLDEDCVHHTDYGQRRHAEAHNLYGMQMARASREGALAHRPNRRPFVITRAGYAGVQRYALVWTGDNSSTWEHLNDSLQMLLNLSVSGVPFCGSDVGGFLDNATPELLVRWVQMGAFTPFFRNHSNIDTIDQEPWALGQQAEVSCRRSIELRYRLLPYLYSLFLEASRSGSPIMRPLFWHYQDDPVAVAGGDQFLLGPDLLVAPILRQGAMARSVYLPRGDWFNYWTGERVAGKQHIVAKAPLEMIPLFVRGGAIVPMGKVQQFIGQKLDPVIRLNIWAGGTGQFEWYEDDGVSLGFDSGEFHTRRITASVNGRGGRIRFARADGSLSSAVKSWRIIVHAAKRAYRVTVNGGEIPARWDRRAETLVFTFRNSPPTLDVRLD